MFVRRVWGVCVVFAWCLRGDYGTIVEYIIVTWEH